MLVLSRKPLETVYVGNNITITVLSIRGGVVKLGIEAPGSVRILRGELPNWNDADSHHQRTDAGVALATA